MKEPKWRFIRRFNRGNGLQTSVYEEVRCTSCEKECRYLVNLSNDEMRPTICPKEK